MSNWKAVLVAAVDSGTPPTYEELDKALSGAMEESAFFEKALREMAGILGKLAAAYMRGNQEKLNSLLDALIKEHCVVRGQENQGGLH